MTIASAIDKINDKLAGSDKYAPVTIEGALDCLAETIPQGGWGGSIAPATADTLGGVKIGDGISVTADGTISAGGGSQYDGEILITVPESSADPTTCEVISGSYSDIVAKHEEGGFVSIGVMCDNKMSIDNTSYGYTNVSFAGYEEEHYLLVTYYDPISSTNTALLWQSDDTVIFSD